VENVQAGCAVEDVHVVHVCLQGDRLAAQPNLFGDISLVWTWGRIGTNDNSRTSTVPDREHAQLLVERLIRRRIRRRYELVAWT